MQSTHKMNSSKKHRKVDTEIYVVFILLISISVFNAIYSSSKIEKNQEVTTNVIEVEIPSIEILAQLNDLVTRSKMYVTNWVYLPYHSEDKQKLTGLIKESFPRIKKEIEQYACNWGIENDSAKIIRTLSQIEILLESEAQITSLLSEFADYEDPMKKFAAEEIIENEVLPNATHISAQLNDLISAKQSRLALMHIEIQESYRNLVWNVLGMAIVIILVVLLSAFYLSHFIIIPVMKLKDYILQLGRGEIPVINYKAKNKAIEQMTDAIVALSKSFTVTAHVAYEIGEGRFDVDHKLLGEQDELGLAIISMRDKLKRAQYEVTEYTQQLQLQNDILQQARHALFEKAKELELANKYKSEFLANMSHELRTPLNSILILANILADNKKKNLAEKELEYVRIIKKSGADLVTLINDILDLSKIEAGRLDLINEKILIREFTHEIQILFEELAIERKIHFGIEIYSDVPQYIIADNLRLAQIIRNLLSNAFKFTEASGEVILRLKNVSLNDIPMLEFSVQDTGIGIPEEKQQMIFEAFSQADGSTNRKYGGTGLGLSISKMLSDLMHGSIRLTSKINEGSTFYFCLPINPVYKTEEVKEKVIIYNSLK